MPRRVHVNGHLATTAGVLAAGLAVGRWLLHESRRIDFRGRLVLITGGSRGLGLVLAWVFAAVGAPTAFCARVEREMVRARAELAAAGAHVHAFVGDMTNAAQVRQLMNHSLEDEEGPIDVVVNNAGLFQVGPYDSTTVDDYDPSHADALLGTALRHPDGSPQDARAAFRAHCEHRVDRRQGQCATPVTVQREQVRTRRPLRGTFAPSLAKDNVYVTTVCPGLMRIGAARRVQLSEQQRAEYALFAAGMTTHLRPPPAAPRMARRIVGGLPLRGSGSRHWGAGLPLPPGCTVCCQA